ncbi:MAG: hypothetical protein PHV34_11850 [Verrucomicrobiae bacterium]|nr:hypothetical protein [Verrucomicrobiae bacterium]
MKKIALSFLIGLGCQVLHSEPILITSDPPLPASNFVKNPGFEEPAEFSPGVPYWEFHGTGPEDGLSTEAAHSGKYSIKLTGKRGENKSFRQLGIGKNAPLPFKKDLALVVGAWSKATGVLPTGGVFGLALQAGNYLPAPSFAKDSHEWTYAEKILVLTQDVAAVGPLTTLFYDQVGTAYFDDFYLSYANVQLALKVDVPDLKQVCLLDEANRKVFDSGLLSTNRFERTLEVRAQHTYCVKAEDQKGKMYVKHYPALDRKLDLLALYKAKRIKVETNMTLRKAAFPAMGIAGVFDGSPEYGSGVYEGEDPNSSFAVELDHPYRISKIGLCLKPRGVESAELSIRTKAGWRKIKDYRYANSQALAYVYLRPSELVEAVKVNIGDSAGLKSLAELELYEDAE